MENIPGVCGTAMLHMQRSAELKAMLEALEPTALPTKNGVALTLVASRGVVGQPFPWTFELVGGRPNWLTFDKLGSSQEVTLPVTPREVLDLEFRWGPNSQTKAVRIHR